MRLNPGDEPKTIPTLEKAEQELIRQAMKHFDGSRKEAAAALGISQRTLYRKLQKMNDEMA